MSIPELRRWQVIAPAVCLAVFIAASVFMLAQREFDVDEFQHLHIARSVACGQVLYRDFFDHHGPGLPYLLAPFHLITGDRLAFLFAGRLLMVAMMLTIIGLTYQAGRACGGGDAGVIAAIAVMLSPLIWTKGMAVRPDTPALMAILGWIIAGTGSLCKRGPAPVAVAGVCGGLTVVIAPKSAFIILVSAVGLFIGWASMYGSDWRSFVRRVLILTVCGVLPLLLTAGGFAVFQAFDSLIDRALLINLRWRWRFSPRASYGRFFAFHLLPLVFAVRGFWVLACRGSSCLPFVSLALAAALIKPSLIPEPFLQSFLPIPALSAILAGVGIMDTVQRGGRRPRALLALTASSIAMAGWMISPEGISTEHLPSPRWIPPLVLVVVAAGSSRSRLRMAAVISGAALLAGLTVDSLSGLRSNRHQLAMVQWVTETVGDDETFLDGWTGFGTLRNHAYQFFSPHVGIRRMMTADEKDDRVVEILLANPPRLLAADGALQSLSPRVSRIIEERYRWTGKAVFWEPRPPGEIGTPAERKVAPKGQKKRDRTWLQRAAPMVPTPTPKPAQPTGKPSRPSKGHL